MKKLGDEVLQPQFLILEPSLCIFFSGKRVIQGIPKATSAGDIGSVNGSRSEPEPSEASSEGPRRRALRFIKPNYPSRLGLLIIGM